jgi:hypothetical protein
MTPFETWERLENNFLRRNSAFLCSDNSGIPPGMCIGFTMQKMIGGGAQGHAFVLTA